MVEYDADLLDPIFRAFYSSILTKITNFTISELSILTDDEISDLVKEKFSHLPDAEVDRIIEAEISSFFGPIQALISLLSIFFPSNAKHEEITPPPAPSITIPEQDESDSSLTLMDIFFWVWIGQIILVIVSVGLYDLRQRWLNSWFRSWMYKDVTNTTAKEALKLSKRSRSSLSKYAYARRAIVSKGLKGIGETYIPATNMVFRQDLPTVGIRAASERHI